MALTAAVRGQWHGGARGTTAEVWFDYGLDGVTFGESRRANPPTVSGEAETPVSVDLTNLDGSGDLLLPG